MPNPPLYRLQFIIGIFFLLVAVILLAGYFTDPMSGTRLNLYTGLGFLVFGLLMAFVRKKKEN